MFPLLFAAKALAKMSSFGGGSKPARNTKSDAESEQTAEKVIDKQGKEHAADSPKGTNDNQHDEGTRRLLRCLVVWT